MTRSLLLILAGLALLVVGLIYATATPNSAVVCGVGFFPPSCATR